MVEEGAVAPGDSIRVTHRPDHTVTIGLAFRAFTSGPGLIASLREVAHLLPDDLKQKVHRRSRSAFTAVTRLDA